MKRTEKIEIRVSAEEKSRLTAVAERERRTVSQMIRELTSEHIKRAGEEALKPREDAEPMSLANKLGMFGAGAALGILATAAVVALRSEALMPEIAGVEFAVWQVLDDGSRVRSRIVTAVNIGSPDGASFELPVSEGNPYQLSGQIVEGDQGVLLGTFVVCQQAGESCETVSTPTILARPDSRAEMSFNLADRTNVEIGLTPPALYRRGDE